MEEIQSKLQDVVISEVNSNLIIDSISSKKSKTHDTKCQNQENGIDQLQNGSSSPTNHPAHQTSAEQDLPSELVENPSHSLSSVLEVETLDVLRDDETFRITYKVYESELELPSIMKLIQKDLSEPYSIYTYRYFIHNWPKLCYLALYENRCIGCIVCKLDIHRQMIKRGYIAMLAVDKDFRKLKIGTTLVQKAIRVMIANQADEVVLETEITNQPALKLYENLGFVRDKRLFHYYLNGVDALRLKVSC